MRETIDFLIQHGYTVLFAWVLVEQLGLPIPSLPLLLALPIVPRHEQCPQPLAVPVSDEEIEAARTRGLRAVGMLVEPDGDGTSFFDQDHDRD